MISYRIHLIRTGSTLQNPWKRYVGQQDLPLSEKGRDALAQLKAEYLYPKVSMVFSSPLTRCLQTAELLYPNTFTVPVDGLIDMNLGAFEGKSFEQLRGNPAFSAWLEDSFLNPPPDGEAIDAFNSRIVQALDQMFRQMMAQQVSSAAAITHGGVIMALLAAVGLPRLPLPQWAAANGTGYTLLMNTQLWMRDRSAEVAGFLPGPPLQDNMELYGDYADNGE